MSVEFESETVLTDEMSEDEAMQIIQNPEHFLSPNEQLFDKKNSIFGIANSSLIFFFKVINFM